MNKKNAFLFIAFLILVIFQSEAFSADSDGFFKKDEPIDMTGDTVTYEKAKNTYYGEGNVVVVQGTTTLKADRVVVDMDSGVATASGGVEILSAGGDYLKGSTVTVDMNKDTAVAVSGRLFFKEGNIYVFGHTVKKIGPRTFDSEESVFTTCDCEEGVSPAWSLRTAYSKMKAEGFYSGWNAFFYVKDVPILYSPFIAAPARMKRQTGFLTPRFGYSSLRGAEFDNAFFWAISDSTDSTFYLDVETKRGVGEGVEYRYYRTKTSRGEIYFYHFSENDINRVRGFRSGANNFSRPFSAGSERWEARFSHREDLASDVILRADVLRVSDDEYFIDFASDQKVRSLESLESTVSATKNWEAYSLVAQFRVFDNLFLKDDSTVVNVLPAMSFSGERRRLSNTPVFLSINSALVNFERGKGDDGQRLDVRPGLSLPLKPGGWVEVTSSFSPRLTFYRMNGTPADASFERYHDRYIYEFKVDSTTTLVRYFDTSLNGVEKLRHTIRPRLVYTYVPAYNQDRLPDYDGVDRIGPENSIRYSVNSTVAGHLAGNGRRDIFYMDLSQSYDIRETRGHDGGRRPFSDINGEMALIPVDGVSLSTRGAYDVYDKRFENYDAAFRMDDERGNNLFISYRYIRSSTGYIEAALKRRLSDAVYLGFRQRYSFRDSESISRDYTVEYRHQCWSGELVYTEKLNEKMVMATFSLKGIGEVMSAKASVYESR
ncbi:MAG: LPS-assembly protein LptD [Deltaproteobacteria bacterium]|nr:LPS-assembly protein LptD [Deltaproteobacteria bacterium]